MSRKPHGYKVNQPHEVSLREGALGHWLARQLAWGGLACVIRRVIMLQPSNLSSAQYAFACD